MEIRAIRADEWQLLRQARLTALADSPLAFASVLADEQSLEDAHWQEWATDAAAGVDYTLVVALDDEPVGLAGAFIEEDGVAKVVSMWVAPTHRGAGIGSALLDEVLAWARRAGAPATRLSVTAGDSAATRLYARAGFVDTGNPGALEWNPEIPTRRLRLDFDQ